MIMKKIGFIDYYLDEWHANNYPEMIKKLSNGEFQVCYAYAMVDAPNGLTNKEWSEKYQIELLPTIDAVVEKSDCIIILSPDNPEMHKQLSAVPLSSEKSVYIDKTFAPDKKTAVRIFELADKNNTPCYSCSALVFSSELKEIEKNEIAFISSWGPGDYEIYSIHQIEPVVSLMGTEAKRVMFLGNKTHPSMMIEFANNRRAQIAFFKNSSFVMNIAYQNGLSKQIDIHSDYFTALITELIQYFKTGIIPVSHEQTISVIAIREAGLRAMADPFTWVNV